MPPCAAFRKMVPTCQTAAGFASSQAGAGVVHRHDQFPDPDAFSSSNVQETRPVRRGRCCEHLPGDCWPGKAGGPPRQSRCAMSVVPPLPVSSVLKNVLRSFMKRIVSQPAPAVNRKIDPGKSGPESAAIINFPLTPGGAADSWTSCPVQHCDAFQPASSHGTSQEEGGSRSDPRCGE